MKVIKSISLKEWPRATVATRLLESYTGKVHVTVNTELNVSKLKQIKEDLSPQIEKNYGVRLSYTSIYIKTVALTLRECIFLNGIVEDDEVKIIDEINVSVAIQSEKLGLVTPVIKNADKKSLGEIAANLKEFIEKADKQSITLSDLKNGTFTLSNMGMLGPVSHFTPIINPPQIAILGVGAASQKPVVIQEKIVIRPVCGFSLTFDHRAVDGSAGAKFLSKLKDIIENASISIFEEK